MKAGWFLVLAMVVAALAGCGGGSSGSGGGGGSITGVTVTCPAAGCTVATNQSLSLTIAVQGTGTFSSAFTPYVCTGTAAVPTGCVQGGNSTLGTITAAGAYTAPAAVPSGGSVVAKVVASDGSTFGAAAISITPSLTVTLTCPPLVQIGVQGNVVPPTTYVCTASASDGKGVTYSANGPGISINPSSGALTVTATDNDSDAEGNFPSVAITATAKGDGSTHATATVLVTDWFLAQNGAIRGIQIMTSKGTLVSTIPTVACGLPSFAPDHLSYACLNANYSGFGIYRITVTSTNGTVSVGATGNGNFNFTSNFTDVVDPAYSPDGTQIVFMGEINAAQGVYTAPVNGGATEKQLSSESLAGAAGILTSFPNFSADGTQIFFQHVVTVNGAFVPQIWEMNATDGSDQQVVISSPSGDSFPTRDGLYLIFGTANGIYRANVTGSDVQSVLTQTSGGQVPYLAAISPDGAKVMYQLETVPPGMWYVWTANADGSGQTQITPSAGQLIPTSWE